MGAVTAAIYDKTKAIGELANTIVMESNNLADAERAVATDKKLKVQFE